MTGHARRQHRLTVWGSSRIRWLRPLARRPVTVMAYAATGIGLNAAVILAGGGLFWYALGVLALPLVPGAFVLTALWTRTSVVLEGPAAHSWTPVQKAYLNAERFVPAVRELLPGDDPAEVLRHARMDIARLMGDRHRLDVAHRGTTTGAYGLAAGNPLRARLAERGREIERRSAEIDAEIVRRTEALTELGRTWGEFVYRRDRAAREARANRRAERALSHVEGALDSATEHGDRPDEAAELADRSAAVLAAYRELLGSS